MILIPADPISGAILWLAGTVSASVAAGATAQTFVFFAVEALSYAGLSVGLSWITNAIAGKPKQSVAGIHTEITIGDTAPRRFGVGRYATGGSPLYANTFTLPGQTNKPNEFLVLVYDLSDTPVDGLEKIYVGDSAGTYSTSGHTYPGIPGYSIAEFESGAEWYLWAQFYDGTQTAADPVLQSIFGADPNYPWQSSMIGAGVAYVIMTVRYNPQVFPGIPQLRFQLRGKRLYDPRADSSAGGSGSQRWDNPSTWAWSENPAVAIYNLLRGISAGGRWLYGLQTLNPALLPIDNWFAAMAACDFPITDINAVTEPSYRCGFEINTSQPLVGALEELRKSCNGRLIESGGSYKLFIGAVPAYVMAFDDGHLLIDQNQSFDEFPSLNDTVNAITAKYPEPTQAWNIKDAPPLYNTAFEAADGDRRLPADIAYNAVPFASQVQRLMQASLEEARKFRKHALIMPPQFWPLEPGDVVRWNSTKNGYGNKDFRVDTVTRDPNLNILIGIVECDPADYDFNPDTDYTNFDTLPILGPPSTTPTAPSGLTVTASFRALVLNWVNHPNFDIAAIEIWRSDTSSFGGAVHVADAAAEDTHWVDESLVSVSQHWYWIRYRNKSGAFSAFHPSSAGAGATNSTDVVVTENLAANAATILSYAVGSDLTTITFDGAFHDLVAVGFTSSGAPCLVSCSVYIRNDDTALHGIYIRLVRNGTNGNVRVFPLSGDLDASSQYRQSDGHTYSFTAADTPGAGAASYSFQYRAADSSLLKCRSPVLQVAEIKR